MTRDEHKALAANLLALANIILSIAGLGLFFVLAAAELSLGNFLVWIGGAAIMALCLGLIYAFGVTLYYTLRLLGAKGWTANITAVLMTASAQPLIVMLVVSVARQVSAF